MFIFTIWDIIGFIGILVWLVALFGLCCTNWVTTHCTRRVLSAPNTGSRSIEEISEAVRKVLSSPGSSKVSKTKVGSALSQRKGSNPLPNGAVKPNSPPNPPYLEDNNV